MKKLFLFFLFFFHFYPLQAQSQWAPVGSVYYYSYWFGFEPETDMLEVEVIGDTTIQNKTCRIFQQNSGLIPWNWDCEGNNFLYEEEGEVYFYNEQSEAFDLLYDFNKDVGESWRVPLCSEVFCQPDTLIVEVDSISTIVLNGTEVRLQQVSLSSTSGILGGNDIIYEGIGSATRMFLKEIICPVVEAGVLGLCDIVDPEGNVVEISGEACTVSDLNQSSWSEDSWRIFPNPSNGEIQVVLDVQVEEPILRIFDATGALLQQMILQQNQPLQLSAYTPGIYFLQLTSNREIIGTRRLLLLE